MLRPEAIGRVQTQLSESQRTREPRAASPGTGSPDRLYQSIILFLPQLPGVWLNGHHPAWDLVFGLCVPCGCCGLPSCAQRAWDPAVDCKWIPPGPSSPEWLPAMGRVARLELHLCAG